MRSINKDAILMLFDAAQRTSACHDKNSRKLQKIYKEARFEEFWKIFWQVISNMLDIDFRKKHPNAERIIAFATHFCALVKKLHSAGDDDVVEEPLIAQLFEQLLAGSQNESDIVRFRCCEIINKILDKLEDAQISQDLYEKIQDALTDRLSDKNARIRAQAIVALNFLQNPTDPDCRIISQFIDLLGDANAKVRKCCVQYIACRRDILDLIVERTRDIHEGVSLAAFKRITKFIKYVKITTRRTILFTGIHSSSPRIKDYVQKEFLTCWLDTYNSDILAMMDSLRLDADEKDIEFTTDLYEYVLNKFYFKTKSLKEVFEVLPINDEKLLPYDKLNWETTAYWRLLVKLLAGNAEFETDLQEIVPEVVFLCPYVKGYMEYSKGTDVQFLEKQYIIKQLFHIIRSFQIIDPHSVQSVHKLVEFFVKEKKLMDDTMELIIGTLENTIPQAEARCQYGMQIISDILCPIDEERVSESMEERQSQISDLQKRIATLQEEEKVAVAIDNQTEAEKLRKLMEEAWDHLNNLKLTPIPKERQERTDTPTLCRCLDIAYAILRCAKVSTLTPTLKTINTDFVPLLLMHQSDIIRYKAMRCYAVCCIYDKPTAKQGIHLFSRPILMYQAGEDCDTETLNLCIAAVCDLLRIYSADLLAEPDEDKLTESVNEEHQTIFAGGTSLTSLIQGLVALMDDEDYDVQLKACEGLCKLILEERIHSHSLISRMVLKWCSPIDEDEPEREGLKQVIGHVLERLPYLPNGSKQLENSVLLTIDTLARAPRTNILSGVDVNNIAKFLLSLCKLSPKGKEMHYNIGVTLFTKLKQRPDRRTNEIYTKMLTMLQLSEEQKEEIFASFQNSQNSSRTNATNSTVRISCTIRNHRDSSS